jgi:hypothetical protein
VHIQGSAGKCIKFYGHDFGLFTDGEEETIGPDGKPEKRLVTKTIEGWIRNIEIFFENMVWGKWYCKSKMIY